MKQLIKSKVALAKNGILVSFAALSFLFAGSLIVSPAAQAACNGGQSSSTLTITDGAACGRGNNQPENLTGQGGVFTTVTNVLLFIIGAVSVIMMIIGGIRYTISNGDQGAVTSAKNTILYAVIGLVVAILAYAAVAFVTAQFATGSSAA